MDLHDVRVRESRRDLRLPVEPRDELLVRGELAVEDLHGDVAVDPLLERAVDAPHRADARRVAGSRCGPRSRARDSCRAPRRRTPGSGPRCGRRTRSPSAATRRSDRRGRQVGSERYTRGRPWWRMPSRSKSSGLTSEKCKCSTARGKSVPGSCGSSAFGGAGRGRRTTGTTARARVRHARPAPGSCHPPSLSPPARYDFARENSISLPVREPCFSVNRSRM